MTIAEAYGLNDPLIVAQGRGTDESPASTGRSLISVDLPNIVVETVKRAEDGNGIIVRLYESQRRRGVLTLSAGFELAEAWHTNLLEENEAALEPSGNSVELPVRPYEIVTLRLVPA